MELYLKRTTTLSDANAPVEEAGAVFLGVPFDSTAIDRPGCRYGPQAIRNCFERFEGFNIVKNVDVYEKGLCDLGDVECVPGSFELTSKRIEETAMRLYEKAKGLPIFLGGEHSITLPLVKAIKPEVVVSFDAHLDLRDNYLGNKFTHVTFLRRISEFIAPENIIVVGVRSSSKEEKEFAKSKGIKYFTQKDMPHYDEILPFLKEKTEGKKTYMTIDIDVMDPSLAPGTTSPVPDGMCYPGLVKMIEPVVKNAVAMDIVEVNPLYDRGETTAYHAARLAYEVLSER